MSRTFRAEPDFCMNNQRVLEILHAAKALAREYYQLTGGERLGGPSATLLMRNGISATKTSASSLIN